ncbi:MAG: phosphoribosylformylglycinamidine synthase subunit PurQ [Nitrospinae bacterium]|nr:phosphoribosylformylglycinamidine synthase subunit PurQ [Nitrospinota bacterium]
MKFGVLVFPGSNCDHDCYHVIKHVLKEDVDFIWHKEERLLDYDCIIIPGGFSFGDYLRPGAISKFSPIMKEVIRFGKEGGLILGICNGFQILLESGIVQGTMMKNRSLRFICKDVYIRIEDSNTPFTNQMKRGDIIKIPIAHADGNYFADEETIRDIEENHQIVFRYSTSNGEIIDEANPNGSLQNIAGICNKEGNILGMMPHPERCSEKILGNDSGLMIFKSILKWTEGKR